VRANSAANSAQAVALARAIESARPASTRLFSDPLAAGFLDSGPRAIARLCRVPVLGDAILWLSDIATPGARGNTLGRTRFIDDALIAAIDRGLDQVVTLGAGYDCRAYRLPELSAVAIFEVDHPATQARKRARLENLIPQKPGHVRFVPIDFNERSLADGMKGAGFRLGRRNFFIWEGVTEYLSSEAVDATFRFVVDVSGSGSALAFTYTDTGLIHGTKEFAGGRRLLALNRLGGEPYTFGLDPATLRDQLAERGLDLLEDIAGEGYQERYFKPLGRMLSGNEYERAAIARVCAQSVERPG
jgi:methyltransferase (TIGR00027 family)